MGRRRFSAVVGVSGAGKTSLLHAGLVPAWQAEHPDGLVVTLTPGPRRRNCGRSYAGPPPGQRDGGVGTPGCTGGPDPRTAGGASAAFPRAARHGGGAGATP
ncbi:hypothetical protein [Streptomyces sp. Ag82_O1-12]|uniref:nSTAND1 domain-containing NTPase n=1 Tax=Streptomyces sp. Ag82_O1-12 TaxID=1938854 RepID=UPI0032D8B580